MNKQYIAIYDKRLVAQGELATVVQIVKSQFPDSEPYLFEMDNGNRIDIDWSGDADQVIKNLPAALVPPAKKRGRPKLGVVSKEVTLLPEHWDWLAVQRGGASITLRRLIDAAMNTMTTAQQQRIKQDQLYRMMRVFEDDEGFEAASRAMYRLDGTSFKAAIANWNTDLAAIFLQKFNAIVSVGEG
ncbi:MAG: DUF2239 family protein [Alteromonadaceae bacterium]|nr:DUF2239 family protein [Alteromonadaceae bacterium]